MKLEKATIKVKGKEVDFLKPTVIELIEIEDDCMDLNGNIDVLKYNERMISLLGCSYKVEDFVKVKRKDIELSTGEKFTIPEMSYEEWFKKMKSFDKLSRIQFAKTAIALTGVSGNITLEGFTYDDITNIGLSFATMYDDSELNEVVEQINKTCFPEENK